VRLAVDGRVLVHRPTGVARYLRSLLAESPQVLRSGEAIEVFVDRPPEGELPGSPRVTTLRPLLPGGDPAWRQVRLAGHLARRGDLDVLFCPFYTIPFAARLPRVVTIHDVSFAAHPEWFSRRARLAFGLAGPSARRAARVITVSQFSAGEIVSRLGAPAGRIEVIPLGVDPAWSAPVAEDERRKVRGWLGFEEPYVLHLGAVHRRRRVDLLVQAAALLTAERRDLRIVVAGPGIPPAPDIERLARELGLEGVVVRREWAPEELLRPLLAESAALVYLSEYEGFGLPALEALAVGVPVVALRRTSLPEVLGDVALWIDEPTPKALAGRVSEVLSDSRAADSLRAAGRARAAGFSPRCTAERTFEVLRSVGDRR